MREDAIEAEVIGTEEFYPHTASPGEEVKLYRRLEDMYKPNAIAVLNQKDEPVGYLDPSIAEGILAKMKEGIKFKCVVTGREEDKILIRILELGKPEIESTYPEEEELEELLMEEEEDEEEELDVLNISAVPIVEIDTEDIPIPIEEIEGEEE
ncbi:TPA: hypothetical protein EYP37_09910 [Candidatus Poribacteria bacterium]|nr:hypothetical protein [Candidatus Poribacteria bacterium]